MRFEASGSYTCEVTMTTPIYAADAEPVQMKVIGEWKCLGLLKIEIHHRIGKFRSVAQQSNISNRESASFGEPVSK